MSSNFNSILERKIIEKINYNSDQKISFYEYMNMALYEKKLGYYTRDKSKIGKTSDFYTSSSVGSIFGKTIANNFVELFSHINLEEDEYKILEVGGGDGRFARDVLDELKENHTAIYKSITYYMIETSEYHKKIQYDNLLEHSDKIIWINNIYKLSNFKGIIFSNELIDSFPVHKLQFVNGRFQEVFVKYDKEKRDFIEVLEELSNEKLKQYIVGQKISLVEGQTIEINLNALDWLKSVSDILKEGYVLTIDYGYPKEELYASYRHNGTLMCYHLHIANDNPYINIGNQDITTHVNFSAIIEYGNELDLEAVWFTTQSKYLLNIGILNYLQEIDLNNRENRNNIQDDVLRLNRAIRQLVTPGEMGETFKVLIQQKNIDNKKYAFMKSFWEQSGLEYKF